MGELITDVKDQGAWEEMPNVDTGALYRTGEYAEKRIAKDGFEERGTEEQLTALYCALAEASCEFAEPERTKHVDRKQAGSYYYAPLSELINATRPALGKYGLFIAQPFTRLAKDRMIDRWVDDEGNPREETVWLARVLTIVGHKLGGRLVFTVEFFASNEVKDYGGQVTYTRRYQYQATAGIDAGEPDADELARGDEGPPKVTQRQRTAPQPQATAAPKCPECSAVGSHAPTCSKNPNKPKPAPSKEAVAKAAKEQFPPGKTMGTVTVPAEPEVVADDGDLPAYVANLDGQALYDALFENAQALGKGKAAMSMVYAELFGNPDKAAATTDQHRKALHHLLRLRAEKGV